MADGHQLALDQVRLARRLHAHGDIRFPHAKVKLSVVEQHRHRHVRVQRDEAVDARCQPD